MSDIFLNPITSGGGGVSTADLNAWFNSLGATPNASGNKLVLRDATGSAAFNNLSGNNMVLGGNLGVGISPNYRIHANGAIWAEGNITANASTLRGSNVTVNTGVLTLNDDNNNLSTIQQVLDTETRLIINSAGNMAIKCSTLDISNSGTIRIANTINSSGAISCRNIVASNPSFISTLGKLEINDYVRTDKIDSFTEGSAITISGNLIVSNINGRVTISGLICNNIGSGTTINLSGEVYARGGALVNTTLGLVDSGVTTSSVQAINNNLELSNTNNSIILNNSTLIKGIVTISGYLKESAKPFWSLFKNGGAAQTAAMVLGYTASGSIASNVTSSDISGRVTINVSGYYYLEFDGWGENNMAAGAVLEVYIRINGTDQFKFRSYAQNAIANYFGTPAHTQGIIYLNANDYVEVYLSSGSLHSTGNCNFTGYLIST